MNSRQILHIDIDAFFASVEKLRNPGLRDRPVAVGAGVIASCCYLARKYGLHAGMSLRRARGLCPRLEIIGGHTALYRCFSDRIFELCREYSPSVETFLDEAFCDLSGTERLHGNLKSLACRLREEIFQETGLRVSAGLGPNRMLAKMATASAKPDGIRALAEGETDSFLISQPIDRLPGIGPRASKVLTQLNVHTAGDLRKLSRRSLVSIFGKNGGLFYERCRGEDTRIVNAKEIPRSISRETSFHEHTVNPQVIEGMLSYLGQRAGNTLRRLGLKAGQLQVKISYSDPAAGSCRSLRRLPNPTVLDSEILRPALELYRQLHSRRVALRRVGISLRRLVTDDGLRQLDFEELCSTPASQQEGGPVPHREEAALLAGLDSLRRRYGHACIISGRSLDLLGKLPRDDHGFILRTSCLTK